MGHFSDKQDKEILALMGAENAFTHDVLNDQALCREWVVTFRSQGKYSMPNIPFVRDHIMPALGVDLDDLPRAFTYAHEYDKSDMGGTGLYNSMLFTPEQFINLGMDEDDLDKVMVEIHTPEQLDAVLQNYPNPSVLPRVYQPEGSQNSVKEWLLSDEFDTTPLVGDVVLADLRNLVGYSSLTDAVTSVYRRGGVVVSPPMISHHLLGEVDLRMVTEPMIPGGVENALSDIPQRWYLAIQYLMNPFVGNEELARDLHVEIRKKPFNVHTGSKVLGSLGTARVDPLILKTLTSILNETELTFGDFFDLGGREVFPLVKDLES